MRDLVLTVIVFGALPFVLRSPRLGILMWIWLSVMNPHKLTWGFARDLNFVAIAAAVTLLSILLSRDARKLPLNSVTILMFLLAAWTGVTTLFAFYPEDSLEFWKNFNKTMLLAFLIPMLFHTKEHMRWLLWVITLSVAYFGTKGGVWILLTGGGERVYGPPGSYIMDNNALAVALVMLIPLIRYLQQTTPHKLVRRGLIAVLLFSGVSIIGSYSRGAVLAVAAMLAFLWWKGRNKLSLVVVVALAAPLLFAYLPDKWFSRMDTLAEVEQDTGSAMARLNSWQTMFNIAVDRPLVGGGFMVAKPDIYQRYSPEAWRPAQVAHSIYFQALGEQGFVGLGLYLLLFAALWSKASWMIRSTRNRPDLAWARDFAAMFQVSMIAFAVGGAFLSLVSFDVPYYLAAIMVVAVRVVEKELVAAKPAQAMERPAPPLGAIAGNRLSRGPGGR